MSRVFPHADKPVLVSVGCLNVDILTTVPYLPHSDSRVMTSGFARALGGMATNVACAAAALGPPWDIDSKLIAPIGDDEDGRRAEAELRARRVDTTWLEREPGSRTGLCIILVEVDGRRAIISEPNPLGYANIGRRLQSISDRDAARHLHVDGFHAANVQAVCAQARSHGWTTSLDIDELAPDRVAPPRLAQLLTAFDVMFINRNYARQLFPAADHAERCRRLRQLSLATQTTVLLTLGGDGAILFQARDEPATIAPLAVDCVDSTGAGDVFAGLFLSCRLHGLPAYDAATRAAVGAGLAVTAAGAQGYLPTAAAIEQRIR